MRPTSRLPSTSKVRPPDDPTLCKPARVNPSEITTPALLVDRAAFEHNIATMGAAWPGTRLRPHVKAWKSSALARRLHANGHIGFCCATPREVEVMAAVGLGRDLLPATQELGQRAA